MRIFSIFNSIEGEVCGVGRQGQFSTFIRLAGCNLRCNYCDTSYAQSKDSGKEMSIEQIVKEVVKIGCKKITITGGEPLLQGEELKVLIKELWFSKYYMSIETNGSFPPSIKFLASWVMDYKLSSSGMNKYMKEENFFSLGSNDFVKFVIQNELDYTEAKRVRLLLRKGGCDAPFAFSPIHGMFDPAELIDWMKRDRLFDVIINLQLHKYIWPSAKKEV